MIQLIIDYEDKEVFDIVLSNTNYINIVIPEMENAWLVLLKPEEVTDLEDLLKQPPLKMGIVGSYNMDGTQYIWTEPGEKNRNHSINKYKNKLRPKKVYDENNELISETPYTEAEALSKQVNLIAGHPERILN